jgi:hypothetical protein
MSPQQRQQLTSVGYSAIILVLLLLLIGSPFQLQQQQHMKLMISGADATAFANQQQEIQRYCNNSSFYPSIVYVQQSLTACASRARRIEHNQGFNIKANINNNHLSSAVYYALCRLHLYRKPVATRTFANFINSAAAARQRFQLMNQRLASRASTSSRNNPSSVPLANAGNVIIIMD